MTNHGNRDWGAIQTGGKGCQQPQEVEEVRNKFSLEASRMTQPCSHLAAP